MIGGRISKAAVKEVITRVVDQAKQAKGEDANLSRADMERFISGFDSPMLRSVAANVVRYADHRDAKKGARVTDKDLDKAEGFFHGVVDGIDSNNNGLSKAELAKNTTSNAIRAAAEYVRAQRGARQVDQSQEN